jgi:hypothetical protein
MGGCAFDTRHAVSKFTLFNRHQREFQDLLVTKQCFGIRPDALTFTAFRNLSISKSERIEIDVLQDEAYDFRNEITNTVYTSVENYASVFGRFQDSCRQKLKITPPRFPFFLDSNELRLSDPSF